LKIKHGEERTRIVAPYIAKCETLFCTNC